jgi:hypothetical protein
VHDEFGSIHWFYKPEPGVGADLMRGFDKASKLMNKERLDFVIDPVSCVWEALPYNGEKFAGRYIRSRKAPDMPHRFQIRPEIMPATEYPYVILHELGHHVEREYITGRKLQAAWVQAYNTSIVVTSIKKDKSEELLEALLAQQDMPSDYRSNLTEEDTEIYKLILGWISHQPRLSVKELDTLFAAECYDDIRAVWPLRGIPKKDLAPIVTEYATKNVHELFAESFAYYMVGKKLPKNIHALMERSLSNARANHEKR